MIIIFFSNRIPSPNNISRIEPNAKPLTKLRVPSLRKMSTSSLASTELATIAQVDGEVKLYKNRGNCGGHCDNKVRIQVENCPPVCKGGIIPSKSLLDDVEEGCNRHQIPHGGLSSGSRLTILFLQIPRPGNGRMGTLIHSHIRTPFQLSLFSYGTAPIPPHQNIIPFRLRHQRHTPRCRLVSQTL
jgi:hypothetical protein